MKMNKSITSIIKNIFASRQRVASSQTDDGDDERTTDDKATSSIPSLEELSLQMAGDDDEDEDVPEEDGEQLTTSIDELTEANDEKTDDKVASSIPSLEELSLEMAGDDDDEDEDVPEEDDEQSTTSIFSLDELANRMELSGESKTEKASSKKEKKEVSRKQPSDQPKRTSRLMSEIESGEDVDDEPELSSDINEIKARIARLERWYNVALAKNLTVRQKVLSKEIKRQEAEIRRVKSINRKKT